MNWSQLDLIRGDGIDLKSPRFSLTTLLGLTAGICVLMATTRVISPLATGAGALLLAAVGAHVAGNALGTHLNDHALRQRMAKGNLSKHGTGAPISSSDFAPPTELSHKASLGRKIVWSTVATAVVGMVGGAMLLAMANDSSLSTLAWLFGAVACGVIGGLSGFLGSSFCLALANAIHQAQRNEKTSGSGE